MEKKFVFFFFKKKKRESHVDLEILKDALSKIRQAFNTIQLIDFNCNFISISGNAIYVLVGPNPFPGPIGDILQEFDAAFRIQGVTKLVIAGLFFTILIFFLQNIYFPKFRRFWYANLG